MTSHGKKHGLFLLKLRTFYITVFFTKITYFFTGKNYVLFYNEKITYFFTGKTYFLLKITYFFNMTSPIAKKYGLFYRENLLKITYFFNMGGGGGKAAARRERHKPP